MASVGELVELTGVRLLTRIPPSASTRKVVGVTLLSQLSADMPADGVLAYVPPRAWSEVADPAVLPENLLAVGVVGVVIENSDVHVPPEFLDACIRSNLPVFLLPSDSSLADVEGALRGDVDKSGPRGIEACIADFETATGTSAWLAAPGRIVAGRHPHDTATPLALLETTPISIPHRSTNAAAIHVELAVTGYAVVVANPSRVSIAHRLFTALATTLAGLADLTETRRAARARLEAALINELVAADSAAAVVDPWAFSFGLRVGVRFHALWMHMPRTDPGHLEDVANGLHDLAVSEDQICLAGVSAESVCAIVTFGSPEINEAAVDDFEARTRILRSLIQLRRRVTPVIGLSSAVMSSSDDLVRALINARQMAERQCRAGDRQQSGLRLARSTAADLMAQDAAMTQTLTAELLGPVADYDAGHSSSYLDTLRTFLALDAHWGATANELGIHINTLRYRLSRIEKLTGRGLQSTADRSDYYVALCVHDSVDGQQ